MKIEWKAWPANIGQPGSAHSGFCIQCTAHMDGAPPMHAGTWLPKVRGVRALPSAIEAVRDAMREMHGVAV